MTDRLAHMNAEDLSKVIDYIVKHDTGNKTVGDIKKELNLSEEEYYELYTISMPAIRGMNEGRFWRIAYQHLETELIRAVHSKGVLNKTIDEIKDILKRKSLRMLKEERLKGWDVA